MTDTVVVEDRAWLTEGGLDGVSVRLVKHDYESGGEPSYSAGFYLAEEGVGHFCCEVGHADSPADLRGVRDAASVVSGMLAALVEAIDRLAAEKTAGVEASGD